MNTDETQIKVRVASLESVFNPCFIRGPYVKAVNGYRLFIPLRRRTLVVQSTGCLFSSVPVGTTSDREKTSHLCLPVFSLSSR